VGGRERGKRGKERRERIKFGKRTYSYNNWIKPNDHHYPSPFPSGRGGREE
jgi:hypothetical protein